MVKKLKFFLIPCLISLAFFVLACWDLRNPYYAYIGDEYSFLAMAENILDGARPNVFSQNGVFGYHPVLDSYYQAGIMRLLGRNVFGWKASSALLVSLSIVFFYYFLKENFGSFIAFFGAFLMAFSHYLLALVHTGYNNLHALLPLILSLFFATKAAKNNSLIFAFLSGLASGLGFYTFYAARVTFLIVFLFLLLMAKSKLKIILVFLAGFLLSLLPFYYVNAGAIATSLKAQTFFRNKEGAGLLFFWENIKINLKGIFFGTSHVHHYVSGSLIDPLTNLLSAVGVVFLLLRKKWRILLFLLGSFTLIIALCGGLFYEHNPAITRLFIILPFVFIPAAIGADLLRQIMPKPFSLSLFWPAASLALIAFLNLYRFYVQTPAVHPQTEVAIMIKKIRENAPEKERLRQKMQTLGLERILRLYGLE